MGMPTNPVLISSRIQYSTLDVPIDSSVFYNHQYHNNHTVCICTTRATAVVVAVFIAVYEKMM